MSVLKQLTIIRLWMAAVSVNKVLQPIVLESNVFIEIVSINKATQRGLNINYLNSFID